MTWMMTSTGAVLALRNPRADSISALDIAHHLAQINRFTGAARRPYSVAEHSLLVAGLLEGQFGVRHPGALLAALLHDAHEAYCGDVSTPVKQCIGWAWTDLEQPLENRVLDRFGVLRAARDYASLIKRCDLIALATERRDLLPPGGPEWVSLNGVTPAPVDLNESSRTGYAWHEWRDLYIERFGELHYGVHGDRGADELTSKAEA
jgi:hypothetical protein